MIHLIRCKVNTPDWMSGIVPLKGVTGWNATSGCAIYGRMRT